MAFYNQNPNNVGGQGMNSLEDDEQNQQQAGNVQLTSASANNAAPVGAAPSPVNKPTSSGMAPGFQAYARANQGAATNKLAGAAQSNVQNLGQQASTSINQATNKFTQKMDAGSLKNRYQAVQDVANAVNAARNLNVPAQNFNKQYGQGQLPQGIVSPTAQAQPTAANPLNALQQNDVNRFKEVINAKYQGPESIRQAGLYQNAANKVQTADQAVKNTGTAQGREDLLRSMYEKRGDYTRGLNKLDSAILNSSQAGVKNLQNTAKQFNNLESNLDKAQIGSANMAQNRTQEIKDIQEQARTKFSEGKSAEEAATEERLGNVIKDWDKLPEHFRDIIRNKAKPNQQMFNERVAEYNSTAKRPDQNALAQAQKAMNTLMRNRPASGLYDQSKLSRWNDEVRRVKSTLDPLLSQEKAYNDGLAKIKNDYNANAVALNPFEAAVLGVQSGEGLYNLGANAVKTAAYDKEKLISKDEQFRQQALSALAGLDQSNRLDTNLKYADAEKAGTQSAIDALDLEGTRAGLNEAEQNFRDTALKTNLTGHGHKKVSRGNAWGKKTKHYYASVSGNAGNFLKKAGYDFNADAGQGQNTANQKELLKSAMDMTSTNTSGNNLRDDANAQLASTAQGAGTGASIGSYGGPVGTAVGAVAGATVGSYLGSGTIDPFQQYTDLLQGYAPGVGKAVQDVRTGIGNTVGSVLGGGIGGAVSGIDTGAMKAMGEAVARQVAEEDLQNQYKKFLANQGFTNRTAITEHDAVKDRMSALQTLLANLDKTNT